MPPANADRQPKPDRRPTTTLDALGSPDIHISIPERICTRLVPDCGWPTEDKLAALRPSRAARGRSR